MPVTFIWIFFLNIYIYIFNYYYKTKNGVHNVTKVNGESGQGIGCGCVLQHEILMSFFSKIEDQFEDAPPGPRLFQMGLSRRHLHQHRQCKYQQVAFCSIFNGQLLLVLMLQFTSVRAPLETFTNCLHEEKLDGRRETRTKLVGLQSEKNDDRVLVVKVSLRFPFKRFQWGRRLCVHFSLLSREWRDVNPQEQIASVAETHLYDFRPAVCQHC